MLQEARREETKGVDVVVGLVETHGRAETAAMMEGLVMAPRRRTDYRGTTLEEMDLDGIVFLRPKLVLVDELAHSNAPGSRMCSNCSVSGSMFSRL
jgi:two-component system sensor histidine kinase KdpD